MRAGPTRVMVFHHEYLAFGYRYWPEGVMQKEPTRKARSSIGLVSIGTSFIALSPVMAMLRLDIPLLVMWAINLVIFLYTVINMRIGYHFFNESAGSKQTGTIGWGPSQTFHVITAVLVFIVLVLLSIEQCCMRCRLFAAPKWATPYVRRVILIAPMLVAGDGAAQAVNHINPAYTTAWHYDIMSNDYSIKFVKDSFCTEFYRMLAGSAATTIIACFFASASFVLSIFMVHRTTTPMIACSTLAFLFIVAAVGITADMRNAITCGARATPGVITKEQGNLSLSHGFICLCGAFGFSFVNLIFSIATRNIVEESVEASAIMDCGPSFAAMALAAAEDGQAPATDNAPDVVSSTQHLPAGDDAGDAKEDKEEMVAIVA